MKVRGATVQSEEVGHTCSFSMVLAVAAIMLLASSVFLRLMKMVPPSQHARPMVPVQHSSLLATDTQHLGMISTRTSRQLCPTPATLKYILTSCKTSLTQGRYTWRHNQVLKSLAAALESKRNTTNSLPLRATNSITAPTFTWEGQEKPDHPPTKPDAGQLAMARDWKMLVNIGQQLIFPPEIAAITLRPDLVLPFNEVDLHNRAHSPMGEFNWRGLWAQETALHRTGSRRSTTRMECKSLSGWSGMQRFCGFFHHQAAERPWYPWTGSATDN